MDGIAIYTSGIASFDHTYHEPRLFQIRLETSYAPCSRLRGTGGVL